MRNDARLMRYWMAGFLLFPPFCFPLLVEVTMKFFFVLPSLLSLFGVEYHQK